MPQALHKRMILIPETVLGGRVNSALILSNLWLAARIWDEVRLHPNSVALGVPIISKS